MWYIVSAVEATVQRGLLGDMRPGGSSLWGAIPVPYGLARPCQMLLDDFKQHNSSFFVCKMKRSDYSDSSHIMQVSNR